MGVASSLIYAPAFYAKTDELIALSKAAAEYNGIYISHLRSEGNSFLEALDELLTIAREAKIAAQVYHLKAAGRDNWPKIDAAIRKIEDARAAGLNYGRYVYRRGPNRSRCRDAAVGAGGRLQRGALARSEDSRTREA